MGDEIKASGLVQGTLHMLILKTLALEPLHGYGIGVRLEQISRGAFQINAGSLFPALRRLERDGLIKGDWRVTENNRRAKYYLLTAAGRTQLKRETRDWEAQSTAIARILKESLGELCWPCSRVSSPVRRPSSAERVPIVSSTRNCRRISRPRLRKRCAPG